MAKEKAILIDEIPEETIEKTEVANKDIIRTAVRSFYDAQSLRIQTGQRLVANMRVKLGIQPSTKTKDASDEAQKLITSIEKEYDLIADALTSGTVRDKVKAISATGTGVISSAFEYDLVTHYKALHENEMNLEKSIKYLLESYPIYTEYLKHVKGCGPLMSAVIISELNPYAARHASSFQKYAGLDVVINEDCMGEGRSRKLAHQVEVSYKDKQGKDNTRMSITFNPFLKTKLLGVLGGSFLKSKSPFADIYYGYKFRLQNRPDLKDYTAGHIHNMAMRYMIKMFLQQLWDKWRTLEGLEVTPTYAEAKLGMAPHGSDVSVQNKLQEVTDANIKKVAIAKVMITSLKKEA